MITIKKQQKVLAVLRRIVDCILYENETSKEKKETIFWKVA